MAQDGDKIDEQLNETSTNMLNESRKFIQLKNSGLNVNIAAIINDSSQNIQPTAGGIKVTKAIFPSLSPIGNKINKIQPVKGGNISSGEITPEARKYSNDKYQDTDKKKHSQSELPDKNEDLSNSIKEYKVNSGFMLNRPSPNVSFRDNTLDIPNDH